MGCPCLRVLEASFALGTVGCGSAPLLMGSSIRTRGRPAPLATKMACPAIRCTRYSRAEVAIWVATSEGLDQFRELPVKSLPVERGSSTPTTNSVLAARDGSIWIDTRVATRRWDHGRTAVYRRRSTPGLADDEIQSLFEDERGRIWVSSFNGLAAFWRGKFTAVPSVPTGTKNTITGDAHGGLWLSLFGTANNYSLTHLVDGKVAEQVPWRDLVGGRGAASCPTRTAASGQGR